MTNRPERPPLSLDDLTDIAINQMDLSPDVKFTLAPNRISAMAVGLTERHRIPAAGYGEAGVRRAYLTHIQHGPIPAHMALQEDFIRRHDELTGSEDADATKSEVAIAVRKGVPSLAAKLRTKFEQSVAAYAIGQLYEAEAIQPGIIQHYGHMNLAEHHPETNRIATGDDLWAELPTEPHAGIVHCAPDCCESIGRLNEAQVKHPNAWQNVALLHSTRFNQAYTQLAAKGIFGISPERVHASHTGTARGMSDLRREVQTNKRLKRGFGAVIMNDVEHVPIEDLTAAIEATPDVLAPGGVLLISARSRFAKGDGTVFDLIDAGRRTFGADPLKIGALSIESIDFANGVAVFTEEDDGGRQAIFVKQ